MSPLDLAVCWYGLTMLACSILLLGAVAWDARRPIPPRPAPGPVDPPPWVPDETWRSYWASYVSYSLLPHPPRGVELEWMREGWAQSAFHRVEDLNPLANAVGLYWRRPLPYTVINAEQVLSLEINR